jgi:hypothetical protein
MQLPPRCYLYCYTILSERRSRTSGATRPQFMTSMTAHALCTAIPDIPPIWRNQCHAAPEYWAWRWRARPPLTTTTHAVSDKVDGGLPQVGKRAEQHGHVGAANRGD